MADQFDDEALAGRRVEGLKAAVQQRDEQDLPVLHDAGVDEHCHHHTQQQEGALGDH